MAIANCVHTFAFYLHVHRYTLFYMCVLPASDRMIGTVEVELSAIKT